MASTLNAVPLPTLRQWTRATWLGWLLGLPCIIVLALAGEAVGIGGTQVLVGAGMGLGVGWMQGWALRGVILSPGRWVFVTAAALGAPFLVTDLAAVLGREIGYSLYPAVGVGGVLVGMAQARLLCAATGRPARWVFANVIGWQVAAGLVALADLTQRSGRLAGPIGALIFLLTVGLGGLPLGLITGTQLRRHDGRCTMPDGRGPRPGDPPRESGDRSLP